MTCAVNNHPQLFKERSPDPTKAAVQVNSIFRSVVDADFAAIAKTTILKQSRKSMPFPTQSSPVPP